MVGNLGLHTPLKNPRISVRSWNFLGSWACAVRRTVWGFGAAVVAGVSVSAFSPCLCVLAKTVSGRRPQRHPTSLERAWGLGFRVRVQGLGFRV